MPMPFVRHQAVFTISFRELLDQTVCVLSNMLAIIAHYPDANRTILLAGKNIDPRPCEKLQQDGFPLLVWGRGSRIRWRAIGVMSRDTQKS